MLTWENETKLSKDCENETQLKHAFLWVVPCLFKALFDWSTFRVYRRKNNNIRICAISCSSSSFLINDGMIATTLIIAN